MEGKIRIESLTLEELDGVVGKYPWYALARRELCRRMAQVGPDALYSTQFADAAMYIPSRELVYALVRTRKDFSDSGAKAVLEAAVTGSAGGIGEAGSAGAAGSASEVNRTVGAGRAGEKIVVVGGDFFSQEQYDSVRGKDAVSFSSTANSAPATEEPGVLKTIEDAFCTETLAQIYVDQGYYDHAIRIYSKLILENPEKNAYFAALIEKLEKEYKN